jgi:1-acyl-sn-glycerol-3-phosphate acyltransferase
MIKAGLWYAMAYFYLVLTYPMLWVVRHLDRHGRAQERDRLADRASSSLSRSLFHLTGSRVHITGLENIPAEGAVIFAGNHQGHMDSLVLHGFLPKPMGFISITAALKYPIIRTWLKYMKSVFVDRDDPRQALTCINQAVEYIREGRSMAVFPEGKLNGGETTDEFRRGWLKLATKSGVPIVPVCLEGSYKALSKDGKRVSSTTVECRILPPVSAKNLKKENEVQFLKDLRATIIAAMDMPGGEIPA